MSKRQLCLPYLVKNYARWPSVDTLSPGAATHHGYHWCKPVANGPWELVEGNRGDVITEADFYAEWESTVKISDHFDNAAYNPSYLSDSDPDDEISLSFSVKEARVMLLALAKYDGMKAKLDHARKSVLKLGEEI